MGALPVIKCKHHAGNPRSSAKWGRDSVLAGYFLGLGLLGGADAALVLSCSLVVTLQEKERWDSRSLKLRLLCRGHGGEAATHTVMPVPLILSMGCKVPLKRGRARGKPRTPRLLSGQACLAHLQVAGGSPRPPSPTRSLPSWSPRPPGNGAAPRLGRVLQSCFEAPHEWSCVSGKQHQAYEGHSCDNSSVTSHPRTSGSLAAFSSPWAAPWILGDAREVGSQSRTQMDSTQRLTMLTGA